jgi:Spy/CpxP family protein refolding chaperone
MVTSQKPTAPVASPNAKSNQPAARPTSPMAAAHPTPPSGGPEPTCFVHRLEEALELVESMQLTNEQKTKISQLTKAQTARCIEGRKQHQATHEQILALLTPDQQQTLQAASDGPEHCHKDSHAAPGEDVAHA